mgnify:CR=1 FL=1
MLQMKLSDSGVCLKNNFFMGEAVIFTAESNFSRHFRGEKLASRILEHTAYRFSPFPQRLIASVFPINPKAAGKPAHIKGGSKTVYQTD